MRRWSTESRQSLRFLAAARYFLPEQLDAPEGWEAEYRECLRYGQFDIALDMLERVGDINHGSADEANFWKELYFAARHLGLTERAQRYDLKLQQGWPRGEE